MDPAAFEEKYDFPMPSRESCSHVVLHCLRGGRSKMGFIILKDLGYKNIGVYEGSFMVRSVYITNDLQ